MGYRTTKSKIEAGSDKTKLLDNSGNSYTTFFYHAFRNVLLVSVPLLAISALILGLGVSHSSASTDQIEFSLSVSCTMSSVVNTAHTKEITNGTYHSNVGKTTITALCNDGNGYTIYATGYSNNEVGNNKLINTTNSQYSIDTGLATSGLTSQWAMKLNNLENDPSSTPPIIESAYDDIYGLVPNNWTKVASRPSGTTDMNLGSSFTTTYSIYISSSQFAGTYRGQVKYALLHPYSNNNTPSFDSFDQAFTFYEKERVTVPGLGSYYAMQDMNNDICSLINVYGEASAAQLADIRDNKLYWVAKLDDGNCWMTQNLDFDISSNTTLNSNTTDLNVIYNNGQYQEYNDGYTKPGDTIYWTPAGTATTINFTGTTVTGWANSATIPYSASKTDSAATGHASLGNYYNWTAAIASNNSTYLNTNNANAANSICPKGWRLPNVSPMDDGYEFSKLLYEYNITKDDKNTSGYKNGESFTKMITNPLYFVLAGGIGSNLANVGTIGDYWASTISGPSGAYDLRFTSTEINPINNGTFGRGYARSVRCLAR